MAVARQLALLALVALPVVAGSSSATRPSASAVKRKAGADDEKSSEHVRCFAVKEEGGELSTVRFKQAAPLEPKEVEVVVHACGLSRADTQLASDEDAQFPAVPGRELIGVIVAAGSAVTSVRPGQRVGVGLQMGDVNGDVIITEAPVRVGGLADRVRVRSRWSFPIPDSLPTDQAVPLLGAGATAWSHLSRAKLKRSSKVGVIGCGGIGHLAAQFASKMGHKVYIIGARAARALCTGRVHPPRRAAPRAPARPGAARRRGAGAHRLAARAHPTPARYARPA